MWEKMCVDKKINIKSFISCFEKHIFRDEDFYFDGESHNFWEMVYITEGEWGISADDRVYKLTEGQVIFHKPMEFHKIWKNSDLGAGCFVCSFELEGDYSFLEGNVFKVNHSQKLLIETILLKIRKYSRQELYNLFLEGSSVGQFVANTLENFFLLLSENTKKVSTVADSADAVLFNKSVNILKSRIFDRITTEKVASMCNVSVSKLNKLFASYAGCGVHSYLIKLKINEAILLLSEGYSSKEISDKLGFNNQNYFSMTFKRETGFSPMNYKKRM